MQSKKIRVLVVDDSAFIRTTLTKILTSDTIEVIDVAHNGAEAVEKNKALQPDIITLDIEMPVMNGLEALKEIMNTRPCPVLMLSSLTSDGAESTIEALDAGAIDFVTKKDAFKGVYSLKEELLEKITMIMNNPTVRNQLHRRSTLFEQKRTQTKAPAPAARELRSTTLNKTASASTTTKVDTRAFRINTTSDKNRPRARDISIITIGISTGGPAALMQVLPLLGKDFPVPILIAQHMPPHFTNSLARRLDSKSQISVKEAEDGETLRPGTAYIAEGGKQMYLSNANKIVISDKPEDELYKPSVNVLFDSVTKYHKHKSIGMIMTGMGHDGSDAVIKMRAAGGFVIAQTIDSCIATGMPETVIKAKQADEIYPLDKIAAAMESLFA